MRAAEKEVELMEKKYLDHSLSESVDDSKEPNIGSEKRRIVSLPSFQQVQALKRQQEMQDHAAEENALILKVKETENQIETLKKRIKALQESPHRVEINSQKSATVFPEDLLPTLANLVAQSGNVSSTTIAADFCSKHGANISKKLVCAKIDEISRKDKGEGDRKAVWHLLPEYTKLLTNETKRKLSKAKEDRKDCQKMTIDQEHHLNPNDGALGPEDEFVPFPHYDGIEEPREARKAFTLFCSGTRKDVKKTMDSEAQKDKV